WVGRLPRHAGQVAAQAVLLDLLLLLLLRGYPQTRRYFVPLGPGEHRRGPLLEAHRDELVLGVGVPDRGRPGAAVSALGIAAPAPPRCRRIRPGNCRPGRPAATASTCR